MHLPAGFRIAAIGEREDPRDAFVSNRYRDLHAAAGRRRGGHLQPAPREPDPRPLPASRRAAAARQREHPAAQAGRRAVCAHHPGRGRTASAWAWGSASPPCWSPRTACRRSARARSASNAARSAPIWPSCWRPWTMPRRAWCVRAERAVSRALAGSCVVPLGAYAEREADGMHLRGFVASPDGTRMVRGAGRVRVDASGTPRAWGSSWRSSLPRAARARFSRRCRMSEARLRPVGPALAGRVVLVTRPAGQGEHLAEPRARCRGRAFVFPTLAIEPVAPSAHAVALLRHPRCLQLGGVRQRQRRGAWPAASSGGRRMAAGIARGGGGCGHRRRAARVAACRRCWRQLRGPTASPCWPSRRSRR